MSTGNTRPTFCEVELVALCSQKTDPVPVCYTLNGVSQTIYAVLKHPHKGAPTVAFMAADFTSFNATTGGTFAVGECAVDRFAESVHWCEATSAAGFEAYVFAGFPNASFPATTNVSDTYLHAIENGTSGTIWGTNGTAFVSPSTPVLWSAAQPAVNAMLAASGLPANSIILGAYQNQPIVYFNTSLVSVGDFSWWIGTSVANEVTDKLKVDRLEPLAPALPTSKTCKEGKALYTRNANNQVVLNSVVSLAGALQAVDPAIIKNGSCPEVVRAVEFQFYKTVGTAISGNYLGNVAGGNGGNEYQTLPVQPAFSIPFEVRVQLDGIAYNGNAAGNAFGANWPTVLSNGSADLCAYLNALSGNTAPKDTWVPDVNGNGIFLSNTLNGSASNHDWQSLEAYQSTNNGGGEFWFKGNQVQMQSFNSSTTANCRKIEVVKSWTACNNDPVLTAYELNGVALTTFDPLLLVESCPCISEARGLLTTWAV